MSGQFSPYLNPSNAGETAELEKIDMTKVTALKEQLKMLLGDTGQRQDNLNLLFQLGSALMTGKTLKGGLAGFFDVAGAMGLHRQEEEVGETLGKWGGRKRAIFNVTRPGAQRSAQLYRGYCG